MKTLFKLRGLLLILLSSCSIYKQQFDCSPPKGVPCASVTEIENLIVETDDGSDFLLMPEANEENYCFWCGCKKSSPNCAQRKIWFCQKKQEGDLFKGYYLNESEISHENILEPEEFFQNSQMIKEF